MKKEQSIEMGNTTVSVTEENGVVRVEINSEDAVVVQNGNLIWSKGNDKEEFKHIPPVLHPFFLQQENEYMAYDKKKKQTVIDTCLEGLNITFYLSENRNEPITVRYDFIEISDAREYILEQYEETDAEGKRLLTELEENVASFKAFIEEKGWRFAYSHATGHWAYGWADVLFTIDQWNEETMREIARKIKEFNDYTNRLYDQLQ